MTILDLLLSCARQNSDILESNFHMYVITTLEIFFIIDFLLLQTENRTEKIPSSLQG